jgi:hypothetical protein
LAPIFGILSVAHDETICPMILGSAHQALGVDQGVTFIPCDGK